MDEISRLIVAVDSTSVPKAKTELDAYTESAAKADAATGKLAQTSRASNTAHAATAAEVSRAEQAVNAFGETQAQVDARLRSVAQAAVAEREAMAKQASAMAQATSISAGYSEATKRLVAQQNAQMSAWTKSRAPVVELEALLSKNTLTTAEVAKANALLDKAQASGVISAGELAAAFKALDAAKIKDIAVTEGQVAANKQLLNSRATSEIATGLSEVLAGNPARLKRTGAAFLNQSGFFAKMFTLAGLGITAVVAGLGALAVAYAKGEAEQTAFAQSLLTTGGYADKTTDQLQDLAKQLDGMQGVTEHAAAGVIASVVATGQFSGKMVDTVSKTALAMEQLGQPTEKTIQQFEELGKDPVNGLLKLNETTHFLTQSVYDQVTTLDQLGEKDKAAQIAQDAYAQAMQKRAADVSQNLGALQRAWASITGTAKEAWDAMLDVGRSDTLDDKITAIKARLKEAQAELNPVDALTGRSINLSPAEKAAIEARIKFQQEALAKAQAASVANGGIAHGAAAGQKLISDRIAAQQALSQGYLQLDPQGQLQRKLDDLAAQRYKALLGVTDDKTRAQINSQFNALVADAAKKYNSATKPPRGSHADPLSGLSNMVAGLTARSLDVPGNATLTAYVQGVAKLVDEYDKAIAKGGSVTKATAEYDEGIKALSADLAVATAKQKAAVTAYQQAVDAQTAAQKAQLDLQVQSIGMGDREIQQAQALAQIRQQSEETIRQLTAQRNAALAINPHADTSALDAQITAEKNALQQRLANQKQYYGEVTAMQADWENGAIQALRNWADQGANIAGQVSQAVTGAFGSMNDALVNFVTTGKLNFSDFAKSVISDIARIALRAAESKVIETIIGAYSGTGGGSMATSFDSNGTFFSYAKGGVFDSPSLSQYSGGVYDSPRFFKFASGGVFGEAGPEAIMPLTRGPDGKLGVKSQGGMGGDFNFSFTYNAANDTSDTRAEGDDQRKTAKMLNDKMKAAALDVINRERMPGGVLWRDRVAA